MKKYRVKRNTLGGTHFEIQQRFLFFFWIPYRVPMNIRSKTMMAQKVYWNYSEAMSVCNDLNAL